MINYVKQRAEPAQSQPGDAEALHLNQRLAFSPRESGSLIGKSATYIYRQIYSGRLKPIWDCGRLMIPRAELDRFLARTGEYNPQKNRKTGGES